MTKWVAPVGNRQYNKRTKQYIVAGVFFGDGEADLLTCSLQKFDWLMRQQYPDWAEFLSHLGRKHDDSREWWAWNR
jgi:hypothetical protein